MMRPGLITATQRSGLPLPEPMRVSAGFSVTGLSGNTLIQTLPPRLMWRVIAMRAASICRAVIQPGSSAWMPYSPNTTSVPPLAGPLVRPRCCLRCLTFLGINMSVSVPVELGRLVVLARRALDGLFLGEQALELGIGFLHERHVLELARCLGRGRLGAATSSRRRHHLARTLTR